MNEKPGGNPEDHEPSLRGQVRALSARLKERDQRMELAEWGLAELRAEVKSLKQRVVLPPR